MKKQIILFCTLFMSLSAFAGGYIEPYMGYRTGDVEVNPTSYKEDIKGMAYGAKLGYSSLGLALGLDYMKSALKVQSSPTSDFDTTDIGAFVQYTFPILVKASATYFLKSEGKDDTGNKVLGKGYKIGAGFTGLPFVTINLDMINVHYDEIDGITGDPDTDVKTYMLSVGLPFNF